MISTPMATRPWKARSSRLLSSTLAASTVLEKDSAIASSMASRQLLSSISMIAGITSTLEMKKCSKLPPMTSLRTKLPSLSLSPTVNSSRSTPKCDR